MAFGPGDISANDWAFSGANTFWTNLSTTVFASGGIGRTTAINCRWGSNNGATITGHNDIWGGGGPLVSNTSNFNVTATGVGSYNSSATSVTWFTSQNYFGGFSRTASQNSNTPFRDGSGGNYGGLSAGDSNISGYTANWAGVGNPGGLGWLASDVLTAVYVRRGGAWTQVAVYVRRGGAWTRTQVFVRRAGAWTTVAWHKYMNETERHIPERGMSIEVSIDGEDWEPGWIIEKGLGWFGPGDVVGEGFNPQYNSEEPADLVEDRAIVYYEWQKAVKEDNQEYAKELYKILWPSPMPGTPEVNSLIVLPAKRSLVRV